jgi:hypothetical protein
MRSSDGVKKRGMISKWRRQSRATLRFLDDSADAGAAFVFAAYSLTDLAPTRQWP